MGLFGELFGGGSEAKRKVDMYEKLIEKLEEALRKFSEYYTQASTQLKEVHGQLTGGPGEAEGKIMTDFTDQEGVWKREYETILIKMQLAKSAMEMRKSEAEMWKEHWENQVKLEEMKGANLNG